MAPELIRSAMAPIRVVLGTMPVLLGDIIRDRLALHREDVEVIADVATRDEIAPALERTGAQVAVLAFAPHETRGLGDFLRTLLIDHPRLAVIALESDGRSGYVVRLHLAGAALDDVSPDSLVRAIRATATEPEDVHPGVHPFSAR